MSQRTGVELDSVTQTLGGTRVLESISLSVAEGTLLGLVGPNGAGKTTLLRTINGVLEPDGGTVAVAGTDVRSASAKRLGRIVATVPQSSSLGFDFSVRDLVAMGRHPHRNRFERSGGATAIREAMERTEVVQFADRAISEVSGGERQRVLLARALAQDTPILLLDEPTASLDVNHQIETLELVRDLVDGGKTAIAAIHDLNLAAQYCDELLMLSDGQELASGAPKAVLTEANLAAAFGTPATVTRHPVTGSVHVTALPSAAQPEPSGSVHVLGGGPCAATLLSRLSVAGYDVSVGPVSHGGVALETARRLEMDAVAVEPFAPIDGATLREIEERVQAADATVLADVDIGAGNLDTLEVLSSSGPVVLVEERPFEERNHVGQSARERYESLRQQGAVTDIGGVVNAIETVRVGGRGPEDAIGTTEAGSRGGAEGVDVAADTKSR